MFLLSLVILVYHHHVHEGLGVFPDSGSLK